MLPRNEVRSQVTPPRTGRMTAIMRAVASRGENHRVLRVGVVRGGQVIEERLLKTRASVTLGPGEDATFVSMVMASNHRLFEISGGVYFLNLLPTMRGKLALEDAVHAVEDLACRSRRVQLSDSARGRIVLGDTTLIFQLVDRPLAQAKPRLPLAVKQGLFQAADWRLTIIVAFSFLAHFGIIGAMYSDWSDPVLDEVRTVGALLDLAPSLAVPPVEVPNARIVDDTARHEVPSTPSNTPRSQSTAPSTRRVQTPTDNSAALVDQAERMRISMMMTFTKDTAVKGAMERDLPPMVLPHADANVTRDRDLTLYTDAPAVFNKSHVDLSTYVNTRAEANDHVAPKNPSNDPAPRFSVDTSVPVQSSPVPSVERTIAQLRPAFRRCYEQGLQANAGMAGDLTMRIKIRPNGEVESAQAVSTNGLSPQVAQCIAAKVQLAQFEPPHGAGSSIDVPVKFVKQL